MKRRYTCALAASLFALTVGVNAVAGAAWATGLGGPADSHQSSSTTGSSDHPQPFSRADQNNTGANTTSSSNVYRSTRQGQPSLNGNGNGNAVGKPCAGCVGRADNKNPPGQEQSNPLTTFPNNGYECDGNHGIGRTNPAHTGCVPSTSSMTPPPGPSSTPPGPSSAPPSQPPPPPSTQSSSGLLTSVFPAVPFMASASAAQGSSAPPQAASAVPAKSGSLAFTGGDWPLMLLTAAAILASGIGLVALARPSRRARPPSDMA